jgi:phytol kinase
MGFVQMERLFRLVPSGTELAIWFPLGLVWSFLVLLVCGILKRDVNWQTPFTRKLNHFVIFSSAAIVSAIGGSSSVCAFALGVTTVIGWSILRGNGFVLYEAMARERDAPYRTYYIILPLSATAIGGILSNLFWGHEAASLGYLVAGIADALAEPVGVKYGRMRYRIPSRAGGGTTRSLEGSLTVLVASLVILCIYTLLLDAPRYPLLPFSLSTFLLLFALACLFTVAEAVAPHGSDNAILQIVPAWAASAFLLC